MTDVELAAVVAQSPAGRDEHTWLRVKDYLLCRLRELVPGEVRFGPYRITGRTDGGGSLCSRVRCDTGLPFVPESDSWEGSFCTSGDRTRSWTDIDVFPFRRGRNVCPGGRHWNLNFTADRWVSGGWTFPDGPGEWGWVKRTGDCYQFPHILLRAERQPDPRHPPIVTVRPVNWFDNKYNTTPAGTVTLSLHDVRRTGESTELGGETVLSLLDPERPATTVPMRTNPLITSGEIGLARLPICGGWITGEYRVSLRVRYAPQRNGRPSGYVTTPITFTIR